MAGAELMTFSLRIVPVSFTQKQRITLLCIYYKALHLLFPINYAQLVRIEGLLSSQQESKYVLNFPREKISQSQYRKKSISKSASVRNNTHENI